jgi:hypothetical protein
VVVRDAVARVGHHEPQLAAPGEGDVDELGRRGAGHRAESKSLTVSPQTWNTTLPIDPRESSTPTAA